MALSAISWRQVLVVKEAGENHRPWASNWYTLSLATASRVHPFVQFTKSGANPRRPWELTTESSVVELVVLALNISISVLV
jgi:hypothetical protein